MQTSDVLNKAADLIERNGWTDGPRGWPRTPDETRALCLEGGIMAASGISWRDLDVSQFATCPAYVAVQNYLGMTPGLDHEGTAVDPLWRFNDGSAAERVVGVLRAAAVIEFAREQQTVAVPEQRVVAS